MYALIFHDKGNEDQKAKFKTFEEAVEAACGIIVPQISEAVEREIESSEEEEGKAVQPETFEMLEILRNLYHHDHGKDEIFARLSVVNGHLERCPECRTPLFAPFLKNKFGEIQVDGQYECIVCIRRELLAFQMAQKAD